MIGLPSEINFTMATPFLPLLTKRKRYKGLKGGRGSAKSWSAAEALVLIGTGKVLPEIWGEEPKRILCAREVQRSIRDSVKRLLDDQITKLGLRGFYESTDTEIRGVNGTTFIFSGMRGQAETIKSLEGVDIAWLEEARNISKESLRALTPTIRNPGAEIWASWNPKHATDPIEQLFDPKNLPPDSWLRRVSHADNPYFPDVLKRERNFDFRRDRELYDHVWEGAFLKSSESAVFKNWVVEDFDTPDDVTFLFGADWGFSVDPSVLVRCFLDEDEKRLYIDAEAYEVGCEITETAKLFDTVPESRRYPIIADSARPETISHMRREGFRIRGAKKGAGSIEDGIQFIKSYDVVIHPRCVRTAAEFAHYRWKVDPISEEVLPVLEDKNNNVIDAVRYAVEGIRRAKKFFA